MNNVFKAFVIILTLFFTLSLSGQIPKRLTIVDDQIYDHEGKPIRLRGFNWGWWGQAIAEDAPIIKHEMNGNVVRLALRWYYWGSTDASNPNNSRQTGAPGHIKPENLALLDQYITWLTQEGIWVELFVNSDQGAGNNNAHFLNTPSLKEEFFEMWEFLVNRYKDIDYIGIYELMAEPHYQKFNHNVSHAQLRDFYKELMDRLTPIDNTTLFAIGPQNYYKTESFVDEYYIPEYHNRVIYLFNTFVPDKYCKGLNSDVYPGPNASRADIEANMINPVAFRNKHKVPVLCDQFGAKKIANGYLEWNRDCIDVFEANDMHWVLWNWRQGSGDFGMFEKNPSGTGAYELNQDLWDIYYAVLNPIIQPTPTPTATSIPTPTPVQYENIAIGKIAKSSSTFSADFGPENAIDGLTTTAWGSNTDNTAQWIYIDLGAVTEIDGFDIKWFNPYYATSYDIYVSNDLATWTPVATKLSGDKRLIGTAPIRYIGLLCTQKNNVAYGLAEFEVLKVKHDPIPTPTMTPTPTVTPTPTSTPVICEPWAYPVDYKVGNCVTYNGTAYLCIRDHTSNAGWTPTAAQTLWQVK